MTDWVYAFDDGHAWAEAAGDGSHSIPTPPTSSPRSPPPPVPGYCGTGRLTPHVPLTAPGTRLVTDSAAGVIPVPCPGYPLLRPCPVAGLWAPTHPGGRRRTPSRSSTRLQGGLLVADRLSRRPQPTYGSHAGSDKSLDLVRAGERTMRERCGSPERVTSAWAGMDGLTLSLHPVPSFVENTVVRRALAIKGNDRLPVRPKRGKQKRRLCSIGLDFPPRRKRP